MDNLERDVVINENGGFRVKDTSKDNPALNRIPWWVWSIILIAITAVLCYKAIQTPIALLLEGNLQYVYQGFGIFWGVVAGALVYFLLQEMNTWRYRKNRKLNLRLELELDIKKVNDWLAEVDKLRNAINGDTIGSYYGYFHLSSAVFTTAGDMFSSGELYRLLSYKQIGELQAIGRFMSYDGERVINAQINQRKSEYVAASGSNKTQAPVEVKRAAVADVDYWQESFEGHRRSLESIIKVL